MEKVEVHHLIEQRLAPALKGVKDLGQSIVVTPQEHQQFTNLWRQHIPYGSDYYSMGAKQVWEAAQEVYALYPTLLEAVKVILEVK